MSFLKELEASEKKAGIYLWQQFLSAQESDKAFEILNEDFPWDLNPKLFGEKLTQHAYLYKRNIPVDTHKGLAYLEDLCEKIEDRFDCEVWDVFCNRFQDATHRLQWHTDTYASHIFVLTLGSERNVQFRRKKRMFQRENRNEIETVRPKVGDLYFMPLQLNNTHEHRVCPPHEDEGTRLSFVFFVDTPKYAKEFKITKADQVRGFIAESMGG